MLHLLIALTTVAPAPEAPKPLPLPGSPGPVLMDYLAVEASPLRVWVPAGNTGKVDVIDAATLAITPVAGFPTAVKEGPRGKREVGPSSVTIGEHQAFIGNRANNEVCAVDRKTLQRGTCVALEDMPDGLAYVASTQEVWVTTPRSKSLTIIDVRDPAHLKVAAKLPLDGEPEGYAVDGKGHFITNLEDRDGTVVFDVATRKEVLRGKPGCGEDGPRGLAVDVADHALFVACPDHVVALDLDDKLKVLASVDTGVGLDNIDFAASTRQVFAAGGKAGTLTIAGFSGRAFTKDATLPSSEGARVVVATPAGKAFAADSKNGRLMVAGPVSAAPIEKK
jgi:DNA-binding beta-propeller fold protein YncE